MLLPAWCASYQHDILDPVNPTIRRDSGEPPFSLPMEPTLADAAATFRVTSDLACSLATDSQPAETQVVNSVGDFLRHEKLRRLEKVM